jgi:hypothetical protein
MIYYLVTRRYSSTIRRLLRDVRELRDAICYLSYEELFYQLGGPIGHYIFCDIDRLSRYEREIAGAFARSLRLAAPTAKLLNDPAKTLDRVPLLAELHRAGINDFAAVRLDIGARPSRFPVFIRTEDGHFGPETDLLMDEASFDAALGDLRDRGLPLCGRIAVDFAGKPDADGRYRRYSAYKIGERIFADELFISEHWAVKDAVARWDRETIAEELKFIHANPHEETLRKAFAAGHIDFGRADYGVVDGRVQIYEINTNPDFAIGPRDDARNQRRAFARRVTVDALRALNAPLETNGHIGFSRPRPSSHPLRRPSGWRLATSTARRFRRAFRSAR